MPGALLSDESDLLTTAPVKLAGLHAPLEFALAKMNTLIAAPASLFVAMLARTCRIGLAASLRSATLRHDGRSDAECNEYSDRDENEFCSVNEQFPLLAPKS